jgi:hypothetical protein
MTRLHRIALAAGTALLMAACGSASDSPLAPQQHARHDSGYATGSNLLPDSAQTQAPASETVAEDGGLATGSN